MSEQGRQSQPETPRRRPIEAQSLVRLEKVIVRADLDRTIARIGDRERPGGQMEVGLERRSVGGDDDFAGNHKIAECGLRIAGCGLRVAE